MRKKYVFIKDYKTAEGTIPKGTEIVYFKNGFYMNGYLVSTAYMDVFGKVLTDPNLKREYIKEEEIIHNKV